ncbi:uncharacterized protein LOC117807767 [Notolabrus celidotus]|uniref:uncharacterized protein LOC117807767 n=1 Tax=Notolabrus celidotus TaxID=1203425 RepID=UPI00148F71BC|nr:uncharacterized protein LOC117807767 [Notolabrus celidotus]
MVLARVRDKLDNQELKKLLDSMPKYRSWSWIGLTRSFLLWSDGSEATFTPWKPLQALNNKLARCGVLQVNSNSLGMTNINCYQKRAFFCYQAPIRKHLVRLTLTTDGSSLNMSAPAVQEAILKWVEKTLRDQGKSEHLKLSWTKPPEKVENTKQDKSEEGMCRP